MKKLKRLLSSRRGESSYISMVVFVLVAVMFIALILNLFSVISAKQQLDICADQLTRQIQLSGEVGADTETLFNMLKTNIGGVKNVSYQVDTTYCNGQRIQLGTPFQVTVTAEAALGGFGDIALFRITLKSSAAGVSEEYWK